MLTAEVAAAGVEGDGDAAGAQAGFEAQVVAAGGVEVAGVADGDFGGDLDVIGVDGRILESLGIEFVAVARAGEVIPDGELADGTAQITTISRP